MVATIDNTFVGVSFYEFMAGYLNKVDKMSSDIEKTVVAVAKLIIEIQDAVTEFSKKIEDFKKRAILGESLTTAADVKSFYEAIKTLKEKVETLVGVDGKGGKYAEIKAAALSISFDWTSYDSVSKKFADLSNVVLSFVPAGCVNFCSIILLPGSIEDVGSDKYKAALKFLQTVAGIAKADTKDTTNFLGYLLPEGTSSGKYETVGYTSLSSYYLSSVSSEEARTMQKLTQLMSLLNQYASQVEQSLEHLMKTICNNMRSS